jgi:hypothetical protein
MQAAIISKDFPAPPLSVFCISLPPARLSESFRFTARYSLETSLS